ncbi:MAG: T9SS type A sorting domain-containing protein [Bacteroidota bacterium]|nr:T9SS type A sorting domain-containing protein [Bacteroidota bacterium]
MRKILTTYSQSLKAGTLIVFLGLALFTNSLASHIAGAEITYQWVSGNTYLVKLDYYRDCSGIPVPSLTLNYRSFSCGMGPYSTAMNTLGSPVNITPVCPASAANSSCNGGTLYAVEKISFEATVTLPANCNDWIFYYTECCRNSAVTNLSNSASNGSYISAQLNNLDVPFNNSVQFDQSPVNIIPSNVTTTLGWTTYDVDGDSIIYELGPALDFVGFPLLIPYNTGYTYLQPFLSSTPTTLNYANGLLTVTPNALQVAVVCMKVSEYRNGVFIGYVYRDFQIAVVNTNNNAPSLTGMNGTANFVTNGCPGDTITFDVISSDPDSGQNLSLAMNNIGTGAALNNSGGAWPVGTFAWVPTAGDVSSSPYIFNITVNDDYCDYFGTQSFIYQVFVNGCNTNDVWPGDANSDGVANLYDLLPIGIAYNENGPIRPSANLSWTAQPSADWPNNFLSGINHKHADTDGDGTINFADTTAIFLNYGLNHPLRIQEPALSSIVDLTVTASADTVGLITIVNFDLSFTTPIDSIYGLAFRLYFDPAMIDLNSISVTTPGSLFGTNGVDMIKIDRSTGMNGFVDVAITRINHTNITGTGPVARVTIVTTDNVSGKVILNVIPFDILGITHTETPVTVYGIGDAVVIDPNFVGINEIHPGELVQLYPSPARDHINFSFIGTQTVHFIRVYDLAGKEIMQLLQPSKNTTIELKGLSEGTYLLKAGIGEHTVNKKFTIF